METQFDCSLFSASEASQALAFAIEYDDPARPAQTPDKENYMNSIVVRIEPQDVLFILSATKPEIATRSFAEALARRTALSAIEKDIPAGVELALSARQLDQIPPEIENRLPDFYMDGNRAWLVRTGESSCSRRSTVIFPSARLRIVASPSRSLEVRLQGSYRFPESEILLGGVNPNHAPYSVTSLNSCNFWLLVVAFPILATSGGDALEARRKRDRSLARAEAREFGAPPDAG